MVLCNFFLDLFPDAPGPVCVFLSCLKVTQPSRLKRSAQGRDSGFLLSAVMPLSKAFTPATAPVERVNCVAVQWLRGSLNHFSSAPKRFTVMEP